MMCSTVASRPDVAQRDQLVDLLLILGDDGPYLGVVEYMVDLVEHAVRVEADGHPAERLRGQLRDEPFRTVVAEDRECVPSLEAERGETLRKAPHPAVVRGPGDRLPDPESLLLERDAAIAVALRQRCEELGERRCLAHAACASPR